MGGAQRSSASTGWWSDPRYLTLLLLLGAVPLLWPPLPPLTDALGHLARYHVQTALDGSADLQRFYQFEWRLIGNLGVDLLVVPLTVMFGVELATKLIVVAIPVITGAGLVLVAVQLHGRATPFTAFALPLAYGFPFQFGFLNSTLAVGLALNAFALWLALGERQRLRAALFVPIGLVLWVCHVFGWAVLGLLVVAAAWAQTRTLRAVVLAALPLAPPLLPMLLWRSGDAAGGTGNWFNWPIKLGWLVGVLRDRWEGFDRASGAILWFVVLAALVERRVGMVRAGAWATGALFAAFLLLPHLLLGSAYADMRLAAPALAVALIALNPPPTRRWANLVALAALAFFLARTAATTASFLRYDAGYRQQLAAVPHIPRGARVVVFVGTACQLAWHGTRMEHLGGLALVRRDAFVNSLWSLSGAQLLKVDYPAAGAFQRDPSQIVRPAACRQLGEPLRAGLIPRFPVAAFDYLWLINLPGADRLAQPGWTRVWARPDGALYRLNTAVPPPPRARPPASASR